MFTALNRYVAKHLKRPHGFFGTFVARTMRKYNAIANEWVFGMANIQNNDRILEIGFGPGDGLAYALEAVEQGSVNGIDISSLMVKGAQKRFVPAIENKKLQVQLGDAQQMPYQDGAFTKVFALNVVYFWEDLSAYLKEIQRVLEPNGTFYLFMIDEDSYLPGIVESGVFIIRSANEVQKVLEDHGLSVEREECKIIHEYVYCMIAKKAEG